MSHEVSQHEKKTTDHILKLKATGPELTKSSLNC